MATRLFALLIGINSYQSSGIWSLQSCVEDAKRMKAYLMNDLGVPNDSICLLLNRQATRKAIEDSFMTHLVNNPNIQPGDAMVIYFAGHGSVIPAPPGWFQGRAQPGSRNVEVLCPYDHDMQQSNGRVAGISDRSMCALLRELSEVKGDNITFIADCCFSPSQFRAEALRSTIRWTPTNKAKPEDLYAGLWPGARGQPFPKRLGFFNAHATSHIFFAGCGPGDKAIEGKHGGKFTNSFLRALSKLALHRTSYAALSDYLHREMGDQRPVCLGRHKTRIVFDAIPFAVNPQYVPASPRDNELLRLEVGAVQGITEGSEFSLHIHNYRASLNPSIATVIVSEVHPSWSIVRIESPIHSIPKCCWALITRWNDRQPLRIHLRTTFASFYTGWRVRRHIPVKASSLVSRTGLNVLRVKHARQADISLTLGFRTLALETHDDGEVACRMDGVKIDQKDLLDVIDDAGRFHRHLRRINPDQPLREFIDIELYRLDPTSWMRVGGNLLKYGQAVIPRERGGLFSVVIRNRSVLDLWPYLFYMDMNHHAITTIYHPQSGLDSPLPHHSQLEIGSGQPGSEALTFTFPDHDHLDLGFLKLFLAPKPVTMGMMAQNSVFSVPTIDSSPVFSSNIPDHLWDAISVRIHFLEQTVLERQPWPTIQQQPSLVSFIPKI